MKFLLAAAFCIISFQLFASEKQDAIIAVWNTGEVNVEVYKSNERYIGNPVNSEGKLVKEVEILNLEFKNGKWVGKIYSKKRDRLMNVECLVKGGKLYLTVSAGIASKELEWIRAK